MIKFILENPAGMRGIQIHRPQLHQGLNGAMAGHSDLVLMRHTACIHPVGTRPAAPGTPWMAFADRLSFCSRGAAQGRLLFMVFPPGLQFTALFEHKPNLAHWGTSLADVSCRFQSSL